ncbi:MAG TPA: SDR family oxidoreductase [Kofleriaceae bacterium]|jgi:NAD(P)-dependent dehydrogenase (short-subunit alcohol dehydrogenase family)|nr:SDR family oxidoreductase [Kofleriaceae bacterium]
MKRLLGKFALVTGGSSGIGAACAQALAGEGAAVLACGRRFSPDEAATAPALGQIANAHLDVTNEAEVKARFAQLPELDIVVLSHGTGTFAPILNASTADFREMLEVHITGSFFCAREALRRMQARRKGHIVFIGSHVAHNTFSDCGGYTAAKAGQLGLARVLGAEAKPFDVRVTSLLAGATDTPIWDDRPGFDRSKMMKPAEIAGFVISIVSRPGIAIDEVTVMPPAGAL